MKNKQTAVEWLEQQFIWNELMPKWIYDYFQQAKAMEKEQIKDAYVEGCGDWFLHEATDKNRAEQYYNETYDK